MHLAFSAQGLSNMHGFLHCLSGLQASLSRHSKSPSQPIGSGGTENKSKSCRTSNVTVISRSGIFTYFVAELISLSGVARVTGTGHHPQRKLILDLAMCVGSARPELEARVQTCWLAVLDEAAMLARTVSINSAFGFDFGNCKRSTFEEACKK